MNRRASTLLAAALTLSGAGVLAAGAHADATVALSGGLLGVNVAPRDGADGNHGMIVEPFLEGGSNGRNGFRVRQDVAGRPTFAQVTGCQHNPLFNDVVCTGARGSVTVAGGDGDDVVVASGEPGGKELRTAARTISVGGVARSFQLPDNRGEGILGGGVSCDEQQAPFVGFTIDTGPGADFVGAIGAAANCTVGTFPVASLVPVLNVQGGAGPDVIGGGSAADTLNGGPDNDVLDGGEGDDVLAGGDGNDQVFGGGGNDSLAGADAGADVLDGGAGTADVVDYNVTDAVTVTVGAGADDGRAGEGDFVASTVERVAGGFGNDTMTGDGGPNAFTGNPGNDRLDGAEGNDTLLGNQGNDRLVGGGGTDTLSGHEGADGLDGGPGGDALDGGPGGDALEGGDGNDLLRDRDGERDLVSCGAGVDFVEIDLQDVIRGCENVSRAPADDGLPAFASGRRLRMSGRTVRVRIACPRKAKVGCRGTLELRRGSARGRLLGVGSYDVPLGGVRPVLVSLAGSVPPSGALIAALTSEQGASTIGPRSSVRILAVA